MMECRVVLTDFRLKSNDRNETNQAAHSDEPDLIEVVDVETFDQNGLKSAKKVSPLSQLRKQFKLMEARIVQLENQLAQAKANDTNAPPIDTDPDSNTDAVDIDDDIDLNVTGFE